MANPTKIASSAIGALVMGALSIIMPAAWAVEHEAIAEGSPDLVMVRHISFTDLNLADDTAQIVLDQRVRGAVDDLCTNASAAARESFPTKRWKWRRTCGNRAWNEARPQIVAAVQQARAFAVSGSPESAATPITISSP
jgi:UrcA family protein